MGHFWAQNQHFWTFVSICSIGFSDIVPDDNNEKVTAFDFQEKFYYAQSKVNRSSVGAGDPFLFLTCELWTDFTHYSCVSMGNFEQLNTSLGIL